MRELRAFVAGLPAPQGSKKFVGIAGGRGIMIESSKKVKPWREDVRAALLHDGQPRARFEGAVSVHMQFVMPRPKRLKKPEPHLSAPDISKLVRSTEDAITSSGCWADDRMVVELVASKRYAEILEPTGCFIVITDPFPEFVKPQPKAKKGKPDGQGKAQRKPVPRPRRRSSRPAGRLMNPFV
jgi:crossover junction endodeoxyribonuclease RusA